MKGPRILITSGATREPIDGVRFISNVSTGRTGARLADFFAEAGFGITYLGGEGAAEPSHPAISRDCVRRFRDFENLDALLRSEIGSGGYFAVLHLAAVSDYSVASVVVGERSCSPGELRKIDSGEELGLVLRRNFKIVDRLKNYAGKETPPLVVGFKLTNGADEAHARRAVERVAAHASVDAVVHNDLRQIEETRHGSGAHRFEFFPVRQGTVLRGVPAAGVDELGAVIVGWFRDFRGGEL